MTDLRTERLIWQSEFIGVVLPGLRRRHPEAHFCKTYEGDLITGHSYQAEWCECDPHEITRSRTRPRFWIGAAALVVAIIAALILGAINV